MSSEPMSTEMQASHGHDEIHLPPPSWGPIVLALGAIIGGAGIVFAPILLLPLGLAIFMVGLWRISNFTIIEELRPSMNVNSRMLGMWIFLASEIMFFTGLIATFLGYKARAGEAAVLLNVPLMTIGTFILLTSSFGAVSALSALHENRLKAFRNWLIATMVMGTIFLGVELLEWIELFGHGITPETLFGSAFFTLTGFHGMHVIIGLVWMGFLLVRTLRGKISSADGTGVEIFGLYWHFVDIVWIVLFTIVYLI
jgi:heme/copper-type cytochrome/quinol oxidase subunit 3